MYTHIQMHVYIVLYDFVLERGVHVWMQQTKNENETNPQGGKMPYRIWGCEPNTWRYNQQLSS